MAQPSFLKSLLVMGLVIGNAAFSYGMDSPGTKELRTRFYQKNGFILSEPTLFTDERDFPGNDPDLKELSRTTIRDGLIYDSKNNLLDTEGAPYIYALNHDGTLYTSSQSGGKHHSYFLKSKPEKMGYGIGKNVACAGHIIAKQGKIISIDNSSGHYLPIEDQFKITVQFLHNKGVLDPNISLTLREPDYEGGGSKKTSLESMMGENIEAILAPYPIATKRTHEYIEAQREKEKAFQLIVEQLQPHCAQAFLKKPLTDLFANFHSPSSKGKVDLGEITLENRQWKALLINYHGDLPDSIIQAPPTAFSWTNRVTSEPLVTNIQEGVVTRHATCSYSILHTPEPQKIFGFYLIPIDANNFKEKEKENQEHKPFKEGNISHSVSMDSPHMAESFKSGNTNQEHRQVKDIHIKSPATLANLNHRIPEEIRKKDPVKSLHALYAELKSLNPDEAKKYERDVQGNDVSNIAIFANMSHDLTQTYSIKMWAQIEENPVKALHALYAELESLNPDEAAKYEREVQGNDVSNIAIFANMSHDIMQARTLIISSYFPY